MSSNVSSGKVSCVIFPYSKPYPSFNLEAIVIPQICEKVPQIPAVVQKWKYLENLCLAEPLAAHDEMEIDLLLGVEALFSEFEDKVSKMLKKTPEPVSQQNNSNIVSLNSGRMYNTPINSVEPLSINACASPEQLSDIRDSIICNTQSLNGVTTSLSEKNHVGSDGFTTVVHRKRRHRDIQQPESVAGTSVVDVSSVVGETVVKSSVNAALTANNLPVAPASSRKVFSRVVQTGTAENIQGFVGTPRRMWLYLGRAARTVTTAMVSEWIKTRAELSEADFSVEELPSKGDNKSFKVGVSMDFYDKLYSAKFWPKANYFEYSSEDELYQTLQTLDSLDLNESNVYQLNPLKSRLDDAKQEKLEYYIWSLTKKGIVIEADNCTANADIIFIKLHLPSKVVHTYADIFDFDLACRKTDNILRYGSCSTFMATPLTKPNPKDEVYPRARSSISREYPEDATRAEKIWILAEIMKRTRYGQRPSEYGIYKLLEEKVFIDSYPLHDGPYEWTDTGPLNDRQLLARFWGSLKCWYKLQPLHQIERYYGPEYAFYFACYGFYVKMLIPAAVMSMLCVGFGLVTFKMERFNTPSVEICSSNKVMCPTCHFEICKFEQLSSSCFFSYLTYLFDNPATVAMSCMISFWSTLFIEFWGRNQSVYMLQWNLMSMEVDTSARPQYYDKATYIAYSQITGKREPIIAWKKIVYAYAITSASMILLVLVMVSAFIGIMVYKVSMAYLILEWDIPGIKDYNQLIAAFTSAMISACIIQTLTMVFRRLALWLTNIEYHRTQSQFDQSFIYKNYALSFVNNYSSAFYVAFFKSYEKQYLQPPTEEYYLVDEYMNLVIQYGFVVFFVAGFPLAPTLALVGNLFDLRLDAYRLARCIRRPIPKRVIGALVIATTSEFVPQLIYQIQNGFHLTGYVNSTLSAFKVSDYHGYSRNVNLPLVCYYYGRRNPPGHEREYLPTSDFWYIACIRFIVVVVFEHVLMFSNSIVAYAIPDIPQKIKEAVIISKKEDREIRVKMDMESRRSRSGSQKTNIIF
ncbi:unnamed protein product [Callosobruchus maculatus]|uniref:Anoctamin n=1 Tax=Callosobruchus maculatus TaxID=64391 RepID=A0A653BUM2_CALMS|nr:unnamed protein product [Callosobruchus maculatus]